MSAHSATMKCLRLSCFDILSSMKNVTYLVRISSKLFFHEIRHEKRYKECYEIGYENRYDFLPKDLLLKSLKFFTKGKSKEIFALEGLLDFYTEKGPPGLLH